MQANQQDIEAPARERRVSSTDPHATIEVLSDKRFRKDDDWFGDASFASKSYSYGGLSGRPKHCPDPNVIEKYVQETVQEVEGSSSQDTNSSPRQQDNHDDEESGAKPSHHRANEKDMSISSILRSMATKPSMVAVRFLGWALSKVWRAAFTAVHVHNSDIAVEAVARTNANPGTAFIILPTHRSHADYLLMSYIFFGLNLPVPLIAAGDNLNVPIIGRLLARAGAFFIRRSKSTKRYQLVLEAYMYELARSGAPIEFFIEGGRSRRGHIGKPKVGLLSMIVQMVKDGDLKDALLLPVSLDYDVVPEGNGFANEVMGTAKKKPESLFGTLRAAFEWLVWGKRGGAVYVGFGDRIISVSSLLTRHSRLQMLSGNGGSSLSMLMRAGSSPNGLDSRRSLSSSSSSLVQMNNNNVKMKNNNSSKTHTDSERMKREEEDGENAKLLTTSSRIASPQTHRAIVTESENPHHLHHHHQVPPPEAMFRGGSNTSLATSILYDEDTSLMHDIGRLVVDAQRAASLITTGGVAACCLLMASLEDLTRPDALSRVKIRAAHLVQLLIELGHGHRIPDATLTIMSLAGDIEDTVESLGGVKAAIAPRSRICLRYAAAPVVCRLLPAFVFALQEKPKSLLHVWLCGMYDIEIDAHSTSSVYAALSATLEDDDDNDDDALGFTGYDDLVAISPDLPRDLCELIAPIIYIIATALDNISKWRMDTVVSEDDAVAQVREQLVHVRFPELQASLEIAAAFRACVICKVLKRSPIPDSQNKSKNGKKISGYELEPTYLAPLSGGRLALAEARKRLDELRSVR